MTTDRKYASISSDAMKMLQSLPKNKPKNQWTKELDEQILYGFENNINRTALAKALGISERTLYSRYKILTLK